MLSLKKFLKSELPVNIATVFYLLLMMAYAAFTLSLSITAYIETLKFSLNFAGIQNNWSSDVINFVKIVSSSNECPENTENLFTYTWPGTIEGCNCVNSSYEEKLVF